MNRLPIEKRAQILTLMTEGNSLRAISRIVGCSINTVSKLLVDLGEACADYQDAKLRDLPCTVIECDEIWSFCYSKQRNVPEEHKGERGFGDVWTWTAICADTKLVPSWFIGERTTDDAILFMKDLKPRLANRVQLSTDGHHAYWSAIGLTFGQDVDWAIIEKQYRTTTDQGRYSPPVCSGIKIKPRKGNPDPARISTSYVERQNLTMRMNMRRFTRLTNAHSKKIENHAAAIAIHFMNYNFGRPHKSLSVKGEHGPAIKRTPAMAAGIADHVWTPEEIVRLADPN
jgi:IS1 family transposase